MESLDPFSKCEIFINTQARLQVEIQGVFPKWLIGGVALGMKHFDEYF
jgi:hypothetical protein